MCGGRVAIPGQSPGGRFPNPASSSRNTPQLHSTPLKQSMQQKFCSFHTWGAPRISAPQPSQYSTPSIKGMRPSLASTPRDFLIHGLRISILLCDWMTMSNPSPWSGSFIIQPPSKSTPQPSIPPPRFQNAHCILQWAPKRSWRLDLYGRAPSIKTPPVGLQVLKSKSSSSQSSSKSSSNSSESKSNSTSISSAASRTQSRRICP